MRFCYTIPPYRFTSTTYRIYIPYFSTIPTQFAFLHFVSYTFPTVPTICRCSLPTSYYITSTFLPYLLPFPYTPTTLPLHSTSAVRSTFLPSPSTCIYRPTTIPSFYCLPLFYHKTSPIPAVLCLFSFLYLPLPCPVTTYILYLPDSGHLHLLCLTLLWTTF